MKKIALIILLLFIAGQLGAKDKNEQNNTSIKGVVIKNGLMWQDPPAKKAMDFKQARRYCSTLKLGGYMDWRLPTVDELRSLIQGCKNTESMGKCAVTESCGNYMKCWTDVCKGCKPMKGPGKNGLYLDPKLHPGPMYIFWSGQYSYFQGQRGRIYTGAWIVGYDYANIGDIPFDNSASVRCVRNAR